MSQGRIFGERGKRFAHGLEAARLQCVPQGIKAGFHVAGERSGRLDRRRVAC